MTVEAMPARRRSLFFDFTWSGVMFTGCLGFDRFTRPKEVFVSCSKSSSRIEALGKDAAIITSIALRHGATFEELRKSITREEDGTPLTLIGTLFDKVKEISAEEAIELLREKPKAVVKNELKLIQKTGWTGRECPTCEGHGRVTVEGGEEEKCKACGGTGDEYIKPSK